MTIRATKIHWKDAFLMPEKQNNIILTLPEDNYFPLLREEKNVLVDILCKLFLLRKSHFEWQNEAMLI